MPIQTKGFLLFLMIAAATVAATAPPAAFAVENYARISNKELQSQALRLVKNLRDLVYSYNKKDKELMVEYQADYLATRTTERKALTNEWRKRSEGVLQSSVRDYKTRFLADAVSLRDELYGRLPKRMRRAGDSDIYKNPSNVLAIEAIADHLELLAKALPEK